MDQIGIDHDPLPPLLDAGQERDLARRIEAGLLARAVLDGGLAWPPGAQQVELEQLVAQGRQAWEHFLLANVRLVTQQALAVGRRSGIPTDELFQEGFLALVEALRRFDHDRGRRFSTYAFPWVRNAVLQYQARRGGLVQAPVWRARQARMLRALRQELEADGTRVSDHDLGRHVGRDAAWVRTMLAADQVASGDTDLAGLACPRAVAALQEVERTEPEWLARLGTQQAEVLRLRFGLRDGVERDAAACARRLGVSERTLRRLERQALDQAREVLTQPVAA